MKLMMKLPQQAELTDVEEGRGSPGQEVMGADDELRRWEQLEKKKEPQWRTLRELLLLLLIFPSCPFHPKTPGRFYYLF